MAEDASGNIPVNGPRLAAEILSRLPVRDRTRIARAMSVEAPDALAKMQHYLQKAQAPTQTPHPRQLPAPAASAETISTTNLSPLLQNESSRVTPHLGVEEEEAQRRLRDHIDEIQKEASAKQSKRGAGKYA